MSARIRNFTPLIDSLVDRYGSLTTAAVFGSVWRFAQMKKGKCEASLETIAEQIGVSAKTVERHMRKLVVDGYVEDLTPDRRNAPHEYIPTAKAGLEINVEAFDHGSDGESDRSDSVSDRSDRESDQRSDRESVEETNTGDKEETKDREANGKQPDSGNRNELLDAILDVTGLGWDVFRIDGKTRGRVVTVASKLQQLGADPDELRFQYGEADGFWFGEYWIGKEKGDRPRPEQIVETWALALQFGRPSMERTNPAELRRQLEEAKQKLAADHS